MNTAPSVVMVGRINVGKSSLFNRLTSSAKAIVSSVPGTTRDRNYGIVSWRGATFTLIDTGGVDVEEVTAGIASLGAGKRRAKKLLPPPPAPPRAGGGKELSIEYGIVRQTRNALLESTLVLLLVDAKAGLLPDDRALALSLKKLGKPVLLVCNKADNPKSRQRLSEFFKLGLGEPLVVSAANGSGTGDLLDAIYDRLGAGMTPADVEPTTSVRIALIGRPNVGKSSLVNKLLGQERVIVSPIAQTTREPQDTGLTLGGQSIVLVDTAGLRRHARIASGIEQVATQRALSTLRKADIALFVTEVNERPSAQDRHLAGVLVTAGVGIVIVANKWDTLEGKTEKSAAHATKVYRGYYPALHWVPIVFTSALTGQGVDKVLPLTLAVARQRAPEVPQDALNEIAKLVVNRKRPVQAKGVERPHIYSLKQTQVNPPQFTVELGKRQSLHFSYLRFIENQIRERFDFVGVPLRVEVVTRRK